MNTKPTRVNIDGHALLAFRYSEVEGRMSQGGFDSVLRRLLIAEVDSPEIIVGCVQFYLGFPSKGMWKSTEDSDYGKESKLELAFVNLIPHLPLGFELIRRIFSNSFNCLLCFLTDNNDGFIGDKIIYNIELKESFIKTAQRIVFPKGMNKKAIERELLQILLNNLEENPGTSMHFDDLKASIPLTTKTLTFHLHNLKEDDKIDFVLSPQSDPPNIISVRIKSKGIKHLDGEDEDIVQFPHMVKNYGTYIASVNTLGDNSPISIAISDINTAFGGIIKQIEEKEFHDKHEVLQSVKELQNELGGKQEPKKVKGLMDNLKKKAAWVYNQILKNPVITTYLTQLLLKTTNTG